MDYQQMFNLAITVAAFFGGWVLSRIYASIDRLDENVGKMPFTYVTKEDYRNDLGDIKESLQRIIDKLDGKADK